MRPQVSGAVMQGLYYRMQDTLCVACNRTIALLKASFRARQASAQQHGTAEKRKQEAHGCSAVQGHLSEVQPARQLRLAGASRGLAAAGPLR